MVYISWLWLGFIITVSHRRTCKRMGGGGGEGDEGKEEVETRGVGGGGKVARS